MRRWHALQDAKHADVTINKVN
ncbi:MAG: hypothetical protein ACD_48C00425G0001, partial [uncultured bacterium]